MAWGADYQCPHPSLWAWGTPTTCVGPPCVLGTWRGGLEPIGVLPSSLHWFPSGYNALRRGVKPVRTPVAILGSLGVCIYVPASRHWLISYSPVHLN